MKELQEKNLLKIKLIGQGDVIKYRLKGWAKYNCILEYNAPCQKDIGFFFMPVHITAELIGSEKNTEMDALIDMWINTVYNDPQVKGSETAHVVYMRNGTGSPLIEYSELADLSLSAVCETVRGNCPRNRWNDLLCRNRNNEFSEINARHFPAIVHFSC